MEPDYRKFRVAAILALYRSPFILEFMRSRFMASEKSTDSELGGVVCVPSRIHPDIPLCLY